MIVQPPQPDVQGSGPRGSRMGLAAFAIILILTTVALPLVATAGDVRSGATVTVGASERVAEDLYLTAASATIDGTVERDAAIAAGRVRIDGTVDGSVALATGRADVGGTIRGSLRVAGGSVEITGNVGGDLVVLGGRVRLMGGGSVGGDLIVAGGAVEIRGGVAGDVRGMAVSTTFAGPVGGDVTVESSRLAISSGARITGDFRYLTASDVSVPAGAVRGQTERLGLVPWQGGGEGADRPFGPLLRTVWALFAGAVVVAGVPRLAAAIGREGRSVLRAIGVGLIALIVVPLLVIALIFSTIGLPIGLIALSLFVAAIYLTQVFAGLVIGRLILPRRWNDGSRGFLLLAMTLGVILLAALNFVPVPYVSAVVTAVVTLWGLGAALMALGGLGTTSAQS